jgi:hypothetical protein
MLSVPKCKIRLIPVFNLADTPFDASRLHPSRNNIRQGDSDLHAAQPNPSYNSDIAMDGAAQSLQDFLKHVQASSAAFSHAVVLLKVWSRQRGHERLVGMADINLVHTVLMAYLVSGASKQIRQAPAGSSSWQLFKSALGILGETYWRVWPIVVLICPQPPAISISWL